MLPRARYALFLGFVLISLPALGQTPIPAEDSCLAVEHIPDHTQQRQFRILINQGQQSMERSVEALSNYEAQYPLGPCS